MSGALFSHFSAPRSTTLCSSSKAFPLGRDHTGWVESGSSPPHAWNTRSLLPAEESQRNTCLTNISSLLRWGRRESNCSSMSTELSVKLMVPEYSVLLCYQCLVLMYCIKLGLLYYHGHGVTQRYHVRCIYSLVVQYSSIFFLQTEKACPVLHS